jgi:heat shock protein HslJ
MKKLILSLLVITFLFAGLLTAPILAQESAQCQDEYTVQAGDWLSKIAEKYYGDVLAYDLIVQANNLQSDDTYPDIANPDLIEPGLLLCIPETEGMVASGEDKTDLTGTTWQWQQTLMNNDDEFVPDNPGNYTLQFMADGTVAVQADCNQVLGTYTLDGSAITLAFGPSTMAACPEGSLGDTFVTQLGGAAIYFLQEGDLYIDLMFDSGTMRFNPQNNELAGTSWVVIGYNNGRGGVVSPIIGTELTATFGADGALSGSSGCNTYQAGYEVDGDNISIGLGISTMMACGEPDGIMEQEQEYLTALGTAATYQISGDNMEMRTTEMSRVASFLLVK